MEKPLKYSWKSLENCTFWSATSTWICISTLLNILLFVCVVAFLSQSLWIISGTVLCTLVGGFISDFSTMQRKARDKGREIPVPK